MSCRLGFYDQVKPAGLLCAERPFGPPPSTTASRNSDSSPDLTESFDDRAGRVPTGFLRVAGTGIGPSKTTTTRTAPFSITNFS
jgi:hypothetical protein